MLRKFISAAALVVAMAAPAVAQGGGGMGGQGRGGPPSDHWMTMDSLVAAVGGVDSTQKAGVTMHLNGLNAVYKARVDAMAAGRAAGTRPDSTTRAKWQADADAHYGELRKVLNAGQQAKFDALPKPRLAGGGGRRAGE